MLKNNFFLFYLASNILGIEWIWKIMDLFTSGPVTSVLLVSILVCNSQWHSPDRKNLKPTVKESDWMLFRILYKTIKFHGLRAAIVVFFRRVHAELLWNCILRNQRYIPKLPCTPIVPILSPPKKPSKLPPSNLMNLFHCFVWQLDSYGLWLPLNYWWLVVR